MILTQCPVCAAPLPPTSAKQCSRCKTRYCGPACQKQHWEQGGHDKLCRKIRKGGGAEQYHANNKYAEAVAVAAEACAEDTKGQTCYICTQALHWKTKEGLVRGCACRGTAGFAHVSCLAEQAKILFAEAEENNLDYNTLGTRWKRWDTCSLCEQKYHGVVRCALGWDCWKTYRGRPERDEFRITAMRMLGSGLTCAGHDEDALPVKEAELAMLWRLGASLHETLVTQSNLANTYMKVGRLESALQMKRDVYSGHVKLNGEGHLDSLGAANNYASSLLSLQRFEEAKALFRKTMPVARRALGEDNKLTLTLRWCYAEALYTDPDATLDDLREAVTTLEDTVRIARRVFGGEHPLTTSIEREIQNSQAALAAREAVESIRESVEAMTPGGA